MLSTSAAEVARAMLSVFNGADLAALDGAVVPDYVEHALPPGIPPGVDSLKGFVRMLRAAMPDFRFDIELDIVQDERVAL